LIIINNFAYINTVFFYLARDAKTDEKIFFEWSHANIISVIVVCVITALSEDKAGMVFSARPPCLSRGAALRAASLGGSAAENTHASRTTSR
jgi:hypothetical protein